MSFALQLWRKRQSSSHNPRHLHSRRPCRVSNKARPVLGTKKPAGTLSYSYLRQALLRPKGEAILSQDFRASFPLVHARKDVALILEAAQDLELPAVRATLRQFDRAIDLGHGDEDMSAVYYASAASTGVRS